MLCPAPLLVVVGAESTGYERNPSTSIATVVLVMSSLIGSDTSGMAYPQRRVNEV